MQALRCGAISTTVLRIMITGGAMTGILLGLITRANSNCSPAAAQMTLPGLLFRASPPAVPVVLPMTTIYVTGYHRQSKCAALASSRCSEQQILRFPFLLWLKEAVRKSYSVL